MSEVQDLSFFQKIPRNLSYQIRNYSGIWYRLIEDYIATFEYTVNASDSQTHTYEIDETNKQFAITNAVFETNTALAENLLVALSSSNMKRTNFKVDGSETYPQYKYGTFRMGDGKIVELDLRKRPLVVDNTETLQLYIQNFDTVNSIDITVYLSIEVLQRLTDEELLQIFPQE